MNNSQTTVKFITRIASANRLKKQGATILKSNKFFALVTLKVANKATGQLYIQKYRLQAEPDTYARYRAYKELT